jgi:hypothetical protein
MEMLVPISFFVCFAAVLILRPITKKLGTLLQSIANEKQARITAAPEDTAVRMGMEHMANRLALIEERLDFTERLISVERAPAIARHNRRPGTDSVGYLG